MLKVETIIKDHNDTVMAKRTAFIDPNRPSFESAEENLGKLERYLSCFLNEKIWQDTQNNK